MPLDQTKRLVEENAEHAVEIARMYGAQHASTLIPQPVQQPPQKEEISTTKGGLQDNYPEADPML
ncbi:hypothetical protein [Candidatus Reidiella endopervernicosa]|nr:hypothetical protein [Candidatus Reidiella endopervernicosa]QKQ26873.1 hypothetical protein HUE57_11730 [Candidatus Reidiella endopervernicosa]